MDLTKSPNNPSTDLLKKPKRSYIPKKSPKKPTLYESLFHDNTYKDITFKLKGGTVKAHKIIMCRSKFLHEKMIEENVQYIDLSSLLDIKVFEKVVQYLYTGFFEEIEDWELLRAATLLKLDKLSANCRKHMKSVDKKMVLDKCKDCYKSHLFPFISESKDKLEILKLFSKKDIVQFLLYDEIEKHETFELTPKGHIQWLFKAKEYCDGFIISANGCSYPVHKAIVFKAMGLNPMETSIQLDIEESPLKYIIEYLYLGDAPCPHNENTIMEYATAVLKYLPNEKRMISDLQRFLRQNLRVTPPIDIMRLCMKYNLQGEWRQLCLDTISRIASKTELEEIILRINRLSETPNGSIQLATKSIADSEYKS